MEQFEKAFVSVLAPSDFNLKNIRVDKAHNELLEIGVAEGVLGVASWLTIVTVSARTFWQKRKDYQSKISLCSFSLSFFRTG